MDNHHNEPCVGIPYSIDYSWSGKSKLWTVNILDATGEPACAPYYATNREILMEMMPAIVKMAYKLAGW